MTEDERVNLSPASAHAALDLVQKYGAASAMVAQWIEGALALSLLEAAARIGLLEAARTPRTVDELASDCTLDPRVVTHFCAALFAYGLFAAVNGDTFVDSPDLTELISPDAPQRLEDLLAATAAKSRAIRGAADSPQRGDSLTADDGLALASGIGATALSSARIVAPTAMARSMPELDAAWRAGGRHLEVGCGVGNNLLSIVAAYPSVTAVGIEIDSGIAAEARRRADLLHLSDRVEIRHMDASDLTDERAFHTAQWSQFFFPSACRAAVLSALVRAMRPGGHVFLPLIGEVSADPCERREARQRSITINRLAFGNWKLPTLGAAELQAEVEAGGLTVLRTMSGPANPLALTRGMMLARKP